MQHKILNLDKSSVLVRDKLNFSGKKSRVSDEKQKVSPVFRVSPQYPAKKNLTENNNTSCESSQGSKVTHPDGWNAAEEPIDFISPDSD